MVVRVTTKLATKLHVTPACSVPLDPNPYADWSANLFTAARTQYILLTNTASLYSTILYGRGITDTERFLDRGLGSLGETLREDGFELIYQRVIAPTASRVLLGKCHDRAVTGSMVELVRLAQGHLVDQGLSPFDATQQVNEAPMSLLGYNSPRRAFGAMGFPPEHKTPTSR